MATLSERKIFDATFVLYCARCTRISLLKYISRNNACTIIILSNLVQGRSHDGEAHVGTGK